MNDGPARKQGRPRTRSSVGGVRALERGLTVLEILASVEQISLTELSHRAELPYSTTFRILETLRQRGFVDQLEDSGRYRVGMRAFEVGSGYRAGERLSEVAHPAMTALVNDLNETVNLAVLDGREAVYVHQVEGQHMMRAFTRTGARAPLYCTGVGKVLLAWCLEPAVRELFPEAVFGSFTPHTITNLGELLRDLETVRARGYALDNEERELGVRCVTAPVRDRTGEVTAALSLSAPSSRLPDRQVRETARKVAQAADRISLRLGWDVHLSDRHDP